MLNVNHLINQSLRSCCSLLCVLMHVKIICFSFAIQSAHELSSEHDIYVLEATICIVL